MKSILYVGAALMVSAGIYGFVDYNKTNKSKEFKSLYREQSVSVKKDAVPGEVNAVEIVNKKVSVKEEPVKQTTAVVKTMKAKAAVKKTNKKFYYKQFSRAPLRESKEEVILPAVDTAATL